jgi:hypothetical protein
LTQILPTIVEAPENSAFENILEVHLHQQINTSTTVAEPSHDAATSSQATAGAPRQSFLWAPSPIHTLLGDAELDHVQIDDWDDEAEEEASAATEEEELARVQQEIERLQQEQESILRWQAAIPCAEAHRQNINIERARLVEMQYNLDILRQQGREAPPHNQIPHQPPPPPPSPPHNQIPYQPHPPAPPYSHIFQPPLPP